MHNPSAVLPLPWTNDWEETFEAKLEQKKKKRTRQKCVCCFSTSSEPAFRVARQMFSCGISSMTLTHQAGNFKVATSSSLVDSNTATQHAQAGRRQLTAETDLRQQSSKRTLAVFTWQQTIFRISLEKLWDQTEETVEPRKKG